MGIIQNHDRGLALGVGFHQRRRAFAEVSPEQLSDQRTNRFRRGGFCGHLQLQHADAGIVLFKFLPELQQHRGFADTTFTGQHQRVLFGLVGEPRRHTVDDCRAQTGIDQRTFGQ